MAERLRCAVIGAGVAGAEWLARLTRGQRTTVVALCDSHPQRARELQERYRIPRLYAAYAEAVEQPDLDAVVVATPNHLHAPVALAALKARKHVLVETPVAMNLREATRLIETATEMKCLLMPAQELRFLRATQLARACVQHGELGEVFHARAWWRRHQWPRPGSWRAQRALAGGGCLVDLGQPLVDMLLHLLNDFQVAQVSATGQTLFGPHTSQDQASNRPPSPPAGIFDVEDTGAACLVMKGHRWLTVETSWGGNFENQPSEYGAELFGTKGTLHLFPARLNRACPLGLESILLDVAKPVYGEDCTQYFAHCVLDNKKPLISPTEILAVQRVMDAMVAAAASGKPVGLKNG